MAPSVMLLEQSLRNAVRGVYEKGNLEELTVKRMRKAVEKDLNLQEDFFKKPMWKDKSKQIIEEEAESQAQNIPNEDLKSSQTVSPRSESAKPAKSASPAAERLGKRPLPTESKSKKRRKTSRDIQSEEKMSDAQTSVADHKTAEPCVRENHLQSSSEDSKMGAGEEDLENQQAPTDSARVESHSETEMSDVVDDGPKPKSKKRRSTSGEPKSKVARKVKDSQKAIKNQEMDPDAEEIKRLQGWLTKCGIRKMWFKELAPFGTPKAKIRHLKQLLADAGMTGRYSLDKATEIREARELQADLEAVQAGDKQWGKVDSEEEATRPKRRLARGLQSLDFLNDDDGEETD
ncbi:hypothetical protein MMC26_005079 [Xylographa opegraphella]|nr:hypothetical protein [Xylographa opegraphella]